MNTSRPTNQPQKKQSILGFRTDGLLAPLRQSAQIFFQIIAQTFATYNLLPKEYPGLRGDSPISLMHIMSVAWSRLRFTKEGLPQLILFFSVSAALLFGAMAFVSVVLSLFIGTAQAQSIDPFDPSGMENDIALKWLRWLFPPDGDVAGNLLPAFDGAFGIADADWGIRQTLQQALGFYSDAMLIIAALILFYHLTVMVIQTAHSGVVMGSPQKQVWAPLRLVIAIGLLVPINHSLNSGQYIFLKTAELGSRVASNTWSLFINSMVDPVDSATVATPMATDIASTMILNLACVKDYNARMAVKRDEASIIGTVASALTGELSDLTPVTTTTVMNNHVGRLTTWRQGGASGAVQGILGEENICGWYFVPNPPEVAASTNPIVVQASQAARTVYTQQAGAFNDSIDQFDAAADLILDIVPINDGGRAEIDGTTAVNAGTIFTDTLVAYQRRVHTNVQAYAQNTPSAVQLMREQNLDQYGWAMAGAFLSTVARGQATRNAAIDGGLPLIGGPTNPDVNFNTTGKPSNSSDVDDSEIATLRKEVFKNLGTFSELMGAAYKPGVIDNPTASAQAIQCAAVAGTGGPDASALSSLAGLGEKVISLVFGLIDYVASWSHLWTAGVGVDCGDGTETFRLGLNFSEGIDAFDGIISFGHAAVSTGLNLAGWGAIFITGGSAAGAVHSSFGSIIGYIVEKLGQAAGFAGSLLLAFGMIFLLLGFPFTFVVPLVPFIRFFFGILSWLGDVFESVVAVPLVALAQLDPNGEGFAGTASQAYHFVFSIALRPVLMIFGLIAGLLIFIIAANFFSYAFGAAIMAFGGTNVDFQIFSKIAFTAIFVYTITVIANKAFELIQHIPQFALDWMGKRGNPQVSLGDPSQTLQNAEQFAMGWAVKGSTEKLGGVAKGVGTFAGGALAPGVEAERERIGNADNTGRDRPGIKPGG
jgi:conjugal transfer/type IV secretion protein DotA/TraY